MTGFIIFVGILVLLGMFLRYLRKREIEAFREADFSVFQDFAANRQDVSVERLDEKTAAVAANVVNLRGAATTHSAPTGPIVRYAARDAVFDEIHRNFLTVLEDVLDDHFRVFVRTPLGEFLRVEEGHIDLRSRYISFLVCDRERLDVVCGILLQGASPTEAENLRLLEDVFSQLDKPLYVFPMLANISRKEVRDKIGDVINASLLTRTCPKCGSEMKLRRAVKGASAGKTFWVCSKFPECKGVARAGRRW